MKPGQRLLTGKLKRRNNSMDNAERAAAYFSQGFNCSQSVLAAYAEQFALNQEQALKLAGGFGGGMGRTAETCGAVTGAIMVIGLKFASTTPGDMQGKENAYAVVREFIHRFKGRNVSVLCRELLDCDISTPEGMKRAQQEKLIKQCCPKFIRDAAEILDQLIELWHPKKQAEAGTQMKADRT
jgi:C_GCAxxG_C_C family probable redox protein